MSSGWTAAIAIAGMSSAFLALVTLVANSVRERKSDTVGKIEGLQQAVSDIKTLLAQVKTDVGWLKELRQQESNAGAD